MSKSDDSSSSSEDEQSDLFLSVCDPSFSKVWAKPKRNISSHENFNAFPLESTGDSELDSALRQIKKNIYNSDDSFREVTAIPKGTTLFRRTATAYLPLTTCGSPSVKNKTIPYLKRKFNEIISSQVCVEDLETTVDDNEKDSEEIKEDVLQLLPSVVVQKGDRTERQQTKKDHEKWLKKIRREPVIDERTLEDRCKEVAVSGEFIKNGGMKSKYAEHRNCNERKVERVKLLKVTKGFILHVETEEQARKRIFLSNKNKKKISVINDSAKKTKVSNVKATATDSSKNNSTDASKNIATEFKKKNKRSRKRGGKKKKEVTDEIVMSS